MKFFGSLPRNDKFYKEIDDILELIRDNPQMGNRIQYEKIPKCYIAAYDVPNLFRVQLSRGRRLVYSQENKIKRQHMCLRYLITKTTRKDLGTELL